MEAEGGEGEGTHNAGHLAQAGGTLFRGIVHNFVALVARGVGGSESLEREETKR